MLESTFMALAKGRAFEIENHTIWATDKPIVVVNNETEEETKYKNLKDLYDNAIINGKSLRAIISMSDKSILHDDGVLVPVMVIDPTVENENK